MHPSSRRALLSISLIAALAVGACSSEQADGGGWTFGPELGAGEGSAEPSAAGSAQPSGEASAEPSAEPSADASASPSAAASGDASAAPSASAQGGAGAPTPTPGLSPAPQTPVPGQAVEVTIGTDAGTQLIFDPTEATVPANAPVQLTFENRSTVPHNLSLAPPINTSTNTVVDGGASETIGFTSPAEAGEYQFVCTLHPGMEGVLIVQ